MKILPVGAELFHANGRTGRKTDMTKLIVPLGSFANASKKYVKLIFVLVEIRTRSLRNTNQMIFRNDKNCINDECGTAAT